MKVQKVRDRYIDNPQNVASDPGFSVYVSAAAGSGKTKVLTDRFLRLLLKGVPASKILCLTFTNAAANEMLGRITEQLCHWAILTDSELSQILNQLTGNDYQPDLLEKARSLYDEFFYNIDAIKIQTLHSFCSHILSKSSKLNFNSPGKLDIVSDSDYEKYVRASTDEALKLMFQKNKVHAENITTLYELNTIYQYAKEILQNHKGKIINYLQGDFQDVCLGMYEDFGALYNCEVEELIQVFIEKTDSNHLIRIANILSKENESIGDEILSWLNASDKKENLLQYKKIFLTEKNVPTIKLKVSKEFQKNYQEIIISLIDEQYRIAELFHKISAQNAAKYTESFLVFAKLVISYFELMKVEHGVLEYEDLLIRALHLLRSEEGVNDLLYNIDIAIDHVLIDEAQDLSEIQWELVKIITSEFFKDEELSNHLSNRTIFIVGDIKQSIYGFQGANPTLFQEIKDYYKARCAKLKEVQLDISFRSTSEILNLVDMVCNSHKKELELTEPIRHISFHNMNSGNAISSEIILYNAILKGAKEERGNHWKIPEYDRENEDKRLELGKKIAHKVYDIAHNNKEEKILILLRKRSLLSVYISSELRKLGIEVADIAVPSFLDNLAICDLLSAASFALLPSDDWNLACLLKSPIIGVEEEQLFQFCYNRKNATLWSKIQEGKDLDIFREIYNTLDFIIKLASNDVQQFFSELILIKENEFVQRFGLEVLPIMESFLSKIQEFDTSRGQGLQHFMEWIGHQKHRQANSCSSNACVKIMTIHNAKGLQADTVILADAADSENAPYDKIIWNDNRLFLNISDTPTCRALEAAKVKSKEAQKAENMRLLYVAITRAKKNLYVFGMESKKYEESWYSILRQYIFKKEELSDIVIAKDCISGVYKSEIPDFLMQKYSVDSISYDMASLSHLNRLNFLYNNQSRYKPSAIEKGNIIHDVLHKTSDLSYNLVEKYIDETLNGVISIKDICIIKKLVLDTRTNFPELFENENALSEVELIGEFNGLIINARIDKLIFKDGLIQIIDFKTGGKNNLIAYAEQVNKYKELVKMAYPKVDVSSIKCYILWIDSQELYLCSEIAE